jgi:aspartate/glutamate racemase
LHQFSHEKYKKPYIGIIKLDTKFQRLPGDIGNVNTWIFPVIYYVMKGIFPDKVVNHINFEVLTTAIKAARNLEKQGVDAITTTCGFLAKYQKEISNSVSVPVFSSSLIQIPLIYQWLNRKKRIGVITASSKSLTREYLSGVNIQDIPLVVMGMENFPYFQKVFIENKLVDFDRDRVKAEMIEAAKDLIHSQYELGAIVLECTNMSPYAHDIQKIVDLPIFDMCSLMQWVYSGFVKTIYN